ncbi:hypothetical protein Syun_025159 [Stephania yunnanensis]|uniref:F-box domain-containing protein n=1 Tax=Stephania yunnanensis TaxID=152371 RepID=A0AAP0HUM4_9MAGN
MQQGSLPDHVIFYGIFTKLPTKSLSRFKCINKAWCDWITSPQFKKLHLLNQNSSSTLTEDDFIVLISKYSSDNRLFSLPNMEWNDDNCSRLKYGLLEMDCAFKSPDTLPYVAGSCNGLLLVNINDGGVDKSECPNFYIWNPCRKDDYISLPRPSCLSSGGYSWVCLDAVGFFYDSVLDDYKVIIIVSSFIDDLDRYANEGIIYTTRTNTWRKVRSRVPQDMTICGTGYFTNGAVHWPAHRARRSLHLRELRDKIMVISFSIGSEEWREIPLTMDFEGDYELAPMFSITSRGKLYIHYTYYHYRGNSSVVDFHTKVHELMINKGQQNSCSSSSSSSSSDNWGEVWSLQSGDSMVKKVDFLVDNMVLVTWGFDDNDDNREFGLYNFIQGTRFSNAFDEVLKTKPFSDLNWFEAVRYCRSLVSPRQLIMTHLLDKKQNSSMTQFAS